MAIPYCNEVKAGYCDTRKPKIDATCHDLGKEAGKWIMYDVDDRTCYCICSCLAEGTPVTTGDGGEIPVQQVEAGRTQVLAAGLDLKFHPVTVGQVSGAPPAKTKNTIYLKYTLDGRKRDMIVTMDQPFLLKAGYLVAAGKLSLQDQLVDRNGNAVTIDDLRWGDWEGAFWELATSMDPPDRNYTDHLILSGGLVTGDFAIQVYVDLPLSEAAGGRLASRGRPTVGSREWRAANARPRREAEEGAEVAGGRFTPASAQRVRVPAHASSFLPRKQALRLELNANVPRVPLDNQYYLEECEWLIERVYRPLYPDTNFLFDWYSEEVNSHSWVEGGEQYVYLSGGLARIGGFEYDGVALALAHEVGHLFGRPDLGHGVTCEGQADWYGASVVLRNVWFGEFYFTGTKSALKQLELLFEYLKLPFKPLPSVEGEEEEAEPEAAAVAPDEEAEEGEEGIVDIAGNRYPSNRCRVKTITAAMREPDYPPCASCQATEQ